MVSTLKSRKLAVFTERIGAGVPEVLAPEWQEFYKWLGRETTGEGRLEFAGEESPAVTGRTVEELCARPSVSAEAFRRVSDKLKDETDLCIIIVHVHSATASPVPAGVERALFSAVREAALDFEQEGFRIVILRREVPPEGDPFQRQLRDVTSSGRLIIFAQNGDRWPSLPGATRPEPAELGFRLKALNPDSLNRLQRKICRIRGHFQREIQGQQVCARYLYDASYCVPEAVAVVSERFHSILESAKAIIFDAEISFWLADIAVLVADAYEIPCIPTEAVLDGGHALSADDVRESLLFLPVVDSGSTLSSLLDRFEKKFKSTPRAGITIVKNASFCGGVFGDTNEPVKVSRRGNTVFPLYFLLEVERGIQRSPECEACQSLTLPPRALYGGPSEDSLRSLVFWEMVTEGGFKSRENDAPPWREPLPGSPNFPSILGGEDGAWVGTLALKLLKGIAPDLNPALLVGPDQPGTRLLAGRIRDFEVGMEVVLIPDHVVQRFFPKDDGANEAAFPEDEQAQEWFQRIVQSSTYSKFVICEEFTVSRGTYYALTNLLAALRRFPIAHLVAADFSQPTARKPSDPPRVSLYSFDMSRVSGPNWQ